MALRELIEKCLPGKVLRFDEFRNELTVTLGADQLVAAAQTLRTHPQLSFVQLTDITAVDYLHQKEPRFAVVYHLYSVKLQQPLRLKVELADKPSGELPEVPSITSEWRAANWLERETYDMFGIRFSGHPNLTRILMTEKMVGYPLRKDFPLHGPPEWHQPQPLKRRLKGVTHAR